MGTTVTVTSGRNVVSAIKDTGYNPQLKNASGVVVPKEVQQAAIIRNKVFSTPKGSLLSITVKNTSADTTRDFLLFDMAGIAAAKGAAPTHSDINITTTFAGNSTYATLKAVLQGTRAGSLGTAFKYSEEEIIDTANILIWNGNFEDYNSKSLQNYLQMAVDTYANDPKILVMSTELWINAFFAIAGKLPAGGQLTIIFNLVEYSNF